MINVNTINLTCLCTEYIITLLVKTKYHMTPTKYVILSMSSNLTNIFFFIFLFFMLMLKMEGIHKP